MRKSILFVPLGLWLSGCVSSSDFAATQLQVSRLTQKVSTLETQVQHLQEAVKGQRVVRLPTGAPMRTVKRAANQAANSVEENTYQAAVQLYRSGDINAAIGALEQFNNQYPNSTRRAESLFYLGQAYYAQRRYSEATLPLESLVYQMPEQQVSPKAVTLLKRLYQLNGQQGKMAELDNFIQRQTMNAENLNPIN